jgi:DNA-binding MarR family transcriptional regulator
MGAAGFDDRAFPNGRVLRFCTGADHTTIADVGRHLGVSRQRAAQIVTNLRQRGYVTVSPSTSSGKEKTVDVTPRAIEYLAAHRRAAAKIEQSLVATLGPEGLSSLHRLVTELAGDEDLRLRDYLRQKRQDGGLRYPEE